MWLKKHNIFLIVCWLFVSTLQAQPVPKVQQLIDSESYREALALCDSVIADETQQSNWAYYYSKRGDVYYFLGDLKESLRNYLLSLEQPGIDNLENRRIKEESTSYAGFCYRELGLDQQAERYFRSALEQAFVLGDSAEIAVCYYNISTTLLTQGKLDESMDLLQKAYEIDVLRKDTSAIGFDLTMMGNALLKTGRPQAAVKYYNESIDILAISSGNYNSLAKRYGLLAEAYMEAENWDSAVIYTQKSISLYSEQSDSVHVANKWVQLARINNRLGKYKEALKWGINARDYLEAYPVGGNMVLANSTIADSYHQLKKYSDELVLRLKNVQLIQDLGLLYELRLAYEKTAKTYDAMNNFSKAYSYAELVKTIGDSIAILETNRATEQMRVRYDAEKIESENQLLQMENEVTKANLAEREAEVRNLILLGILIVIVAIAALTIVIIRSRMKMKVLQAEINELRARIKGILEFKPEEVGIVKEQINDSLQDTLTDREFEILNLALSNKNNNQIADEIHLSVNTVKYHLKNIYQKLGVSNRKEALKYAVQITSN